MLGIFNSQFYSRFLTKWINVLMAVTLMLAGVPVPSAQAASALSLPAPGTMIQLSAAREPALIKGITVYPDHPLKFNFIVDRGDAGLDTDVRDSEYHRLVKYFLAALTVPEEDLWVNLSPYERERMSPDIFSQTEMGRDLLAQDYLLKQLTASLLYPEDELGERFWQRVYQKAQAIFGTTDIPVNTFNKVWIVPERAVVYESGASAFVAESRLKVMMEQDYLARKNSPRSVEDKDNISAELIREIVIPEIEREVNEGAHFTQLRQMYHALILATWYKKTLQDGLLGQIYVDRNKVQGVDIPDKEEKQEIYERYLAAFRKGVYNYIKEDFDAVEDTTVVRQYFSGGAGLQLTQSGVFKSTADFAQLSGLAQRNIVSLIPSGPQAVAARLENVLVDLRKVVPVTDAAMMTIERWRDDPAVDVLLGGREGHVNVADEFIAVTDFAGRVMASRPKSEVHAGGLPHMSVNLYIYDPRGRLLFQRRSNVKRESGGRLQVSVSGHVDAGETPRAAVLREAKEEIGIPLDEQRLTQITETNEVFRETPVSDGILRKFVTAYVYQMNNTELAQVQNNYNLNEVMELWLIPLDLFETMILEAPEDFTATVRELALSDAYSVYNRVLAQAPDSAQLAAPELRLLELVRQSESREDQALITALERQKEIIAQGYLGFDPIDPSNPPVWVRNVLEFYQATDPDSYEDLLGRLRGGMIRVGQDDKEAIDGFTTNSTHIIATNHQHYPEISLIKLLDPAKAKANTDAYLKWTVRDSLGNLIGFTTGVIATSVRAFAKAGIFELFVDGAHSPTMSGIERYLKAQGKNVNKGYLHGVLYTFAKLGWLTRSGRQANDGMSFTLTDKGKQILGAVAAYSKVADFDALSLRLSWYLLDESPTDTPESFSQILQELAPLAARGWDLPADMDAELATEVRQHLNGFIVGPLLTVMRDRELNIIPMLLEKREIELTDIAKNERGLSRLKAAFDLLANVGFVERDNLRVRMTKKGEANFRRTLNYGVPVSYYPTYALVEELLFGNPAAVPRYTQEGIETLVDRILNTDGSDKSHEGYFKKVKAEFGLIVEGMFDQQRIPTPEQMEARIAAGEQPFTFVVSDVGAGRGGFLLNMYDVIMNSEFGQLMRDYPDLYRVILVGIDFNRAARSNMSNNFGSRNIPHIILDGDIGKPQEILDTMRAKFDALGVKADIMFNIRSMLDHNRQWADVKDPAAAEAREPISTSVFAYRGELIPNNYLEQNLKE
ncbi:MAG: NUDIX domain-containing protein, partial [Candidatus Omnitrophica bacterium]|nr:NUDIX domain-containing protein [Candidatus Omnitrophota bacterium]